MEDDNLQSSGVGQKFMELLVVADNEMRIHHKEGLESYVLTLLNIVSRRFIDPTLGQNIRLHVVRFIVLESDEVGTPTDRFPQAGGFTVSADADQLLDNFCKWQEVLNPIDDMDTDHWDNAIFISRYDLYDPQGGDSNLLGRGYIGGTCSRSSQCSVNEDDGLGTGLVITHEMGHTLNLNHDSDYGCPDEVNIMSGIRSAGEGSFDWSPCSKMNIRNFLNNPLSSCLDDEPLIEPVPVDVLPGASISYLTQCVLTFGPGFLAVENQPIDCSLLECMDKRGRILYRGVPLMEGTPCADRKWCISGKCVDNEGLPAPVDGAWSSWETDFGPCSRSCGRGVQQRRRYCNNPGPMYGGRGCPGDSIEYQVCNFQPCDGSQDDFRDEQCAATNDEPFNGQYYNWIAYITGQSGDALCDHKCLADDFFWANRSPFQFIDGTQCWDDDNVDSNTIKLCVAGSCREFGCDGKSISNRVYDSCGVCGGDGSSCQKTEQSFSGGDRPGFTTFLTLPIGSTFLHMRNTNIQYTYMTAKVGGIRVLSGDGSLVPPNGRYSAGNMIIRYERNNLEEIIAVDGPTTELIEVEAYLLYDPTLLYVGDVNVRPMIRYQYYASVSDVQVASWQVSDYTECSATCGGGTQTRVVNCVRDTTVPDSECAHIPKPMTSQSCIDVPCALMYEWQTTNWFECSTTCGNGIQQRVTMCVTIETDDLVDDIKCDSNNKPSIEMPCSHDPCPHAVPISCDGMSTADSGMITRLGPTPNGRKCRHVIVAPPGKDIVIKFNLINVDCSPPGEAIFIRDLGDYDNPYRYCGYYPNLPEIVIQNNVLGVEYKATKLGHGYDATYRLVDSSTGIPECYQIYTDLEGILLSPNYPDKYPANARCQTIIVVPPGNKIRLNFRGFRLEDGVSDGNCPNDSLEVVDYVAADGPQTISYCGKQEQMKWRSRSNIVQLKFVSNSQNEYKGYKIKFKMI
ncbi:A disintegrin and metalloproteinase with thrombospondin motifs 13-like isoform X2 [Amphiura filiformis]